MPELPDEAVTVIGENFVVPGMVMQRGIATVRISYAPPGCGAHPCIGWFYDLDSDRRPGERMGDQADKPVRYERRSQ